MDQEKNFLWAPRLWIGRLSELILIYISKFDGENVSGTNRLRWSAEACSLIKVSTAFKKNKDNY